MTDKYIKSTIIPIENNFAVMEAATAPTSANENVFIDFEHNDNKILILVTNGGSSKADVTFHHGNGIQGCNNLVVSVDAGKTVAVNLESGRFKHVSGNYKGYVKVTSASTSVEYQVVVLP